jgi:heat-inducible transcriptional repressor
VLLETLIDKKDERVALAGTANLTQSAIDFPTIRRCSRHSRRTSSCSSCSARPTTRAPSWCGSARRTPSRGLRSTSVVSIGYGPGTAVASMGVVGPTRMDYPSTITAVRAIARYVGEHLGGA